LRLSLLTWRFVRTRRTYLRRARQVGCPGFRAVVVRLTGPLPNKLKKVWSSLFRRVRWHVDYLRVDFVFIYLFFLCRLLGW